MDDDNDGVTWGLMVVVLARFDIITILNSKFVCGKSECRRKFLVLFLSLFLNTAIGTATATTVSSLLLFYSFF